MFVESVYYLTSALLLQLSPFCKQKKDPVSSIAKSAVLQNNWQERMKKKCDTKQLKIKNKVPADHNRNNIQITETLSVSITM